VSLLWSDAVRHEAMPWHDYNESKFSHPVVHSVRNAGFAGYTDDRDYLHDLREGHDNEDHDEGFDENLYDSSSPEPDEEEERHFHEHGEWPDSYYERHDQAYEKAKQDKAREDEPDNDDPDLMKFIRHHGDNTELWQRHGEHKAIDLTQPVHATQSHVSQTHIDRYKSNPGDISDHAHTYGQTGSDYLGEEAPLFVTHNGRLHTTEGHHRVAAALQQGKPEIKGWHYDLDEDPAKTKIQHEIEGDETWKSPHDWDDDDRELYEEY
jgi:hypothetical protein